MNPTSVITALYPPHRRPSGDQCPRCPDPLRLLACLPPAAASQHPCAVLDQLRRRLRPYGSVAVDILGAAHLSPWRCADPVDADHPTARAATRSRRVPAMAAAR